MVEDFKCAFIDHGATFYSDGMVGPCCQIQFEYREPIENIRNEDRFSNIRENYSDACKNCLDKENNGMYSHRSLVEDGFHDDKRIRYLDIRISNKCNLKCRMCNPFYSNKWGAELNVKNNLFTTDIDDYSDIVFSDDIEWIYFTGGEPLINAEHWELLQTLIASGRSKDISLQYNTNLTTVKYKKLDIFDLWSKFKDISVLGSIDAIGDELEYIRSGTKWKSIDKNIKIMKEFSELNDNFSFSIQLVLSIMNVWSIKRILDYFSDLGIDVNIHVLTGPDILALNVIPDSLKTKALDILNDIKHHRPDEIAYAISEVENNINKVLFDKTMLFILLIDNKRNEDLFNLLPFSEEATRVIGDEL